MSESDSDFEMLEKRLEALTPDESILVRERTFNSSRVTSTYHRSRR